VGEKLGLGLVIFGSPLKVAESLAKAFHELRDFTGAEKHDYDPEDQ
jgi:hypothetical protein